MKHTVIETLSSSVTAYKNCVESGNEEWMDKHLERIEEIVENYLPRGSGIDSGCSIDIGKSSRNKLVINTSFHHMNDCGMYDGWTEHQVIITPAFVDFDVRITGRNRNGIEEYLGELFSVALREMV